MYFDHLSCNKTKTIYSTTCVSENNVFVGENCNFKSVLLNNFL